VEPAETFFPGDKRKCARAAELQLSAGDLREIDEAFSKIDIKGAPLSEALDSQIDR
jgi:hypothetical protein